MEEKKIPTLFEAIPQQEYEQITPLISKGRVSIFYKGKNRNYGFITDEFSEKLISTLPYVPVVGIYDEYKQDFTSHNRNRDVARIYGLVPENPNGEWITRMDEDGVERTYYVCDVYLYTGRLTDANKIIGNPQSLELDRDSIKGQWVLMDDGKEYFVYSDAYFVGLSALGKDVKPCFEGAAFFDLLTQFGEFLSQSDLATKEEKNLTGGNEGTMDIKDFSFSNDSKINSIWKAVNPNFSEENGWKLDKTVCQISGDYAIVYTVENSTYERYSYVLKDNGDIELIGEPEVVYSSWIRQEEREDYDKLKEKYSSYSEINNAFAELENNISEKDSKILELEEAKNTYELEANSVKEQLTNELETLRNDYSLLKEEHDQRLNQEKESKIEEYKDLISEASLEQIKSKISDYNLEKELLYTMKKEKPTIFEKESSASFARISVADDTSASGIVSILKKYRKN